MSLEKEIQESIEKNLPLQVGSVLKTRLEKADKDEKEVLSLTSQIEKIKITLTEKEAEIKQYKKLDERNNELDKREVELNKIKHDLDLEMLKKELANEQDKSSFAKSVALGLVRNSEYRRNLFDSQNSPDARDQYGNILYSNKTQTSTETKTID